MTQMNIFGENPKQELEDEIKKWNKGNKEYKIDLPEDGLKDKDINKFKKTLEEQKEKLEKDKAKAKEEADKKAKVLQESKDYLTKEGISFDGKKDDEINKLAEETAKSPKFPFELRIYGDDKVKEYKFEDGVRYKLEDIKKTIIKKYFELSKANLEYDKERNAVFVSIASSAKG